MPPIFFRTTMSRTAMTKEMDHMEMIWASLTCSVVCLCSFIYCVFGWWHLAAGHVLFLIWTCTCELSVGPVDCLLSVTVSESSVGLGPLPVCGCLACMWTVNLWCTAVSLWLVCYVIVASLPVNCDVLCVVASLCVAFIRICFNAWLQLLRRANCFKWLHVYRCFYFCVIDSRS